MWSRRPSFLKVRFRVLSVCLFLFFLLTTAASAFASLLRSELVGSIDQVGDISVLVMRSG